MTNRARTVAALVVALGGCGSASQTYDAQGKDEQIVGEDAEPDPSLHSGRPSVPAPPQPVATLERADAAFTAGAPTERRASGSRALLPRLAWQDDVSDAAVVRRALVAARGKAAVGDGQVRSMVKERDVAIERRRPEGAFRLASLTHLVVGDELRFGLLDLHEAPELDVLVIDDWGLAPVQEQERRDLLEILEDRYGTRSTIVTSQLPPAQWHEHIGEATLADAICDRLLHNAHRLVLKGPSRRKEAKLDS